MPLAPERIETGRLVIRRPVDGDAEAIFARYTSDPAVTTYLGWPRHASVGDTRAFLALSAREWCQWSVGAVPGGKRANEGMLIGSTRTGARDAGARRDGLCVRSRRLGTRLRDRVVARDGGSGSVGWRTAVVCLCHPLHDASAHVLAKCGFEREGVLRRYAEFPNLAAGEPADVVCFWYVF